MRRIVHSSVAEPLLERREHAAALDAEAIEYQVDDVPAATSIDADF